MPAILVRPRERSPTDVRASGHGHHRTPSRRHQRRADPLAFQNALNRRDVASLRQFWTDATVQRFPQETCVGADAIAAYFDGVFAALPDFHMEIASLAEQADDVFVHWKLTATHSRAPFRGVAPTGRRVAIDGIDHFVVRRRPGRVELRRLRPDAVRPAGRPHALRGLGPRPHAQRRVQHQDACAGPHALTRTGHVGRDSRPAGSTCPLLRASCMPVSRPVRHRSAIVTQSGRPRVCRHVLLNAEPNRPTTTQIECVRRSAHGRRVTAVLKRAILTTQGSVAPRAPRPAASSATSFARRPSLCPAQVSP